MKNSTTFQTSSPSARPARFGLVRLPVETVRQISDPETMNGLHALTFTIYCYLLCEAFDQMQQRGESEDPGVLRLSHEGVPALCRQIAETFSWPLERIETTLQLLEGQGLVRLFARHIKLCSYEDHVGSETAAARRMRRMRKRRREEAKRMKASNVRTRSKEISTGKTQRKQAAPVPQQAQPVPSAPQKRAAPAASRTPPSRPAPPDAASRAKRPAPAVPAAPRRAADTESSVFNKNRLGY